MICTRWRRYSPEALDKGTRMARLLDEAIVRLHDRLAEDRLSEQARQMGLSDQHGIPAASWAHSARRADESEPSQPYGMIFMARNIQTLAHRPRTDHSRMPIVLQLAASAPEAGKPGRLHPSG